MIFNDWLRSPTSLDPDPLRYKEWLHLCVFDHRTGTVGIVNTSLTGPPADPRSQAGGMALFHTRGAGWSGNLEVMNRADAAVGIDSIGLEQVAMSLHPRTGRVDASARLRDEDLIADLTATAVTAPVRFEEANALGDGWFSWYAIPRLAVRGRATVAQQELHLDGADAYWDHNWGRWQWGDDIGWEWGTFIAPEPGLAIVTSRLTNRAHDRTGPPMLIAHAGTAARRFQGTSIEISHGDEELPAVQRRIPGALAALHQCRTRPGLPKRMRIEINDGLDHLSLEFTGESTAQLIAADLFARGYGFIHEVAGTFVAEGVFAGRAFSCAGLGVREHVS